MNSENKNKEKKKDRDKVDSEFLENLERNLKEQKENEKKNNKPGGNGGNNDPGNNGRRFMLTLLLLMIISSIVLLFNFPSQQDIKEKSYSSFRDEVAAGKITEVAIINNEKIRWEYQDDAYEGEIYETRIPYLDESLIQFLSENNVSMDGQIERPNPMLQGLLETAPWILIMVIFLIFISRQFRRSAGGAMNFGKSKAKLINKAEIKHTFKDVEGCEEAKTDLQEIISFLKHPKRYIDIGAKIPKGVLLVGPPGTGKTLLAKAVAGEAGVPFFSMSGSDFVEMFVGVGASRVRDMFDTGKKNAPCILFIDEIDAVGRMRGAGYGGGHDEREQTLNQLLVEMDGFDTNSTVIVMAATNRSDVLDRALLRPGRFDRQVVVDAPDIKGRMGILKIHAQKIKLEPKVNLEIIARGTPGFTGADLANLVNEAALLAARDGLKKVGTKYFEMARDKVMMGDERRSMFIDKEEKRNTAYHEAGHTLVNILLEKTFPLHKVTIIPRGRSMGAAYYLPEDGKHSQTKIMLENQLRVAYGGRVAEELVFGDYTTGAAADIQMATNIARRMVREWGMSHLGPVAYGEPQQPVFLGRDLSNRDEVSQETAREVDEAVKNILNQAFHEVQKLLKTHRKKLDQLAEALLEKETLDADEVYKVVQMKKPSNKYKPLDFDQKTDAEIKAAAKTPAKKKRAAAKKKSSQQDT